MSIFPLGREFILEMEMGSEMRHVTRLVGKTRDR